MLKMQSLICSTDLQLFQSQTPDFNYDIVDNHEFMWLPLLENDVHVTKKSGGHHTNIWKVWICGSKVYSQWHMKGGTIRQPTSRQCKSKNVGKKNEISARQDAENTAKRLWIKKLKDGYRRVDGKTSDILVDKISKQGGNVNNIATKINNLVLDLKYTTSDKPVYPMLAVDLAKVSLDDDLKCFIQPKLDGVRCIAIVKKDHVLLQSRPGRQYQGLENIRSTILELFDEGTILDGEMVFGDSFQKTQSVMRKLLKHPSDPEVVYNLFDIVDAPDLMNGKQSTRFSYLKRKLGDHEYDHLKHVETYLVTNLHDREVLCNKFIQRGFEGAMIRQKSGTYLRGLSRSIRAAKKKPYLVKYKLMQDEEFEIVSAECCNGGTQDGAIKLICKLNDATNRTFTIKPDGSVEKNRELYKNRDKLIGKMLTVAYQELTDDGIPRFPIGKAIRNYE